jgi:hypothetical protein
MRTHHANVTIRTKKRRRSKRLDTGSTSAGIDLHTITEVQQHKGLSRGSETLWDKGGVDGRTREARIKAGRSHKTRASKPAYVRPMDSYFIGKKGKEVPSPAYAANGSMVIAAPQAYTSPV